MPELCEKLFLALVVGHNHFARLRSELLAENRRMREALTEIVNWCKSADQENGVELQYVLHRAQRGLKGGAGNG